MASIRVRSNTGRLYVDFYYRGVRCREITALPNTPANRARLQQLLNRIERAIKQGTFSYREFFPNSKRANQFEPPAPLVVTITPEYAERVMEAANSPRPSGGTIVAPTPLFSAFADQWSVDREVEWKRSTRIKVADILRAHLLPRFKGRVIGDLTKQDILNLRNHLAKDTRDGQGLSPARINGILNILRQILEEAADLYQFSTPFRGIKPLRVPKTNVDPLTLAQVLQFLEAVPSEYRALYTVAFFTGLRTSELLGLKWSRVDFVRKTIHVCETWVYGAEDTTKTGGSDRFVSMSSVVNAALLAHYEATAESDSVYVFHNKVGKPLSHHNLANRVWGPTLKAMGLKPRRPYQTRHTAATLWLAAGESPEWIAAQLGHASTKMLFTVYSRYVPNTTRQDGSAIEALLREACSISRSPTPTERLEESCDTSAFVLAATKTTTIMEVQDHE